MNEEMVQKKVSLLTFICVTSEFSLNFNIGPINLNLIQLKLKLKKILLVQQSLYLISRFCNIIKFWRHIVFIMLSKDNSCIKFISLIKLPSTTTP